MKANTIQTRMNDCEGNAIDSDELDYYPFHSVQTLYFAQMTRGLKLSTLIMYFVGIALEVHRKLAGVIYSKLPSLQAMESQVFDSEHMTKVEL